MPHALIVDDDVDHLRGLAELVEREGFTTSTAETLATARAALTSHPPDVILTDLVLPDGRGLDVLKDVEPPCSAEMVLITGNATIDSAIEALRMGITDYLTKPIDLARLKTTLANVARTLEFKGEIGSLRSELRKLGRFGRLIGASPPMQKVYDLIAKVSPTEASVFVVGDSGTGKELVAETVRDLSRRKRGPFLAINCGAVSPNLIESELFGHERGSFTGAAQRHRGHFERASGGTLFLDEVTEMPVELQVKLLRVLETGTVMRIGGDEPVAVDVRIIAATNRNPAQAVTEGKLREDLYYRLNVFPIELPPLRDRPGDVARLATSVLESLNEAEGIRKRFTQAAMDRLERHEWPGNVRELKNVVQRAFILANQDIDVACFPDELGAATLALAPAAPEGGPMAAVKVGVSLGEVERQLILATLEQYAGDKKKTAETLGISLKTLYNRLNLYKRD
ncbi:MAG TPA: sigma-54 dependent transcriptional regulator [Candidatus Eisenbacteria bacterium]|nr:sigma-54 dependent transcriptional regulator [Candidatus Eisenbacteria bacterium]